MLALCFRNVRQQVISMRTSMFIPTVQACIPKYHTFSTMPASTVDVELEKEYSKEIDVLLAKEKERAERRGALEGEVVSTKTSKTVNVMVYHTVYISKYQKTIRRRKKIMAHDAENSAKIGDFVRIVPSRPYSKRKRHILKDIVRRAKIVDFSDLSDNKEVEATM